MFSVGQRRRRSVVSGITDSAVLCMDGEIIGLRWGANELLVAESLGCAVAAGCVRPSTCNDSVQVERVGGSCLQALKQLISKPIEGNDNGKDEKR